MQCSQSRSPARVDQISPIGSKGWSRCALGITPPGQEQGAPDPRSGPVRHGGCKRGDLSVPMGPMHPAPTASEIQFRLRCSKERLLGFKSRGNRFVAHLTKRSPQKSTTTIGNIHPFSTLWISNFVSIQAEKATGKLTSKTNRLAFGSSVWMVRSTT